MSSLAAARADNFYYGPTYDPKRRGKLSKYRKHPNHNERDDEGNNDGERKPKVLVIRFEMPWKVFCDNCENVIAKGVRFNAEKRVVGNYLSSKILEFSMKCCWCPQIIKIETDPKNAAFNITQGARKKIEPSLIELQSDVSIKDLAETLKTADAQEKTEEERIDDLISHQRRNYDYLALNAAARRILREEKAVNATKGVNFVVPLPTTLTADEEKQLADVKFKSQAVSQLRDKAAERLHSLPFERRKRREKIPKKEEKGCPILMATTSPDCGSSLGIRRAVVAGPIASQSESFTLRHNVGTVVAVADRQKRLRVDAERLRVYKRINRN